MNAHSIKRPWGLTWSSLVICTLLAVGCVPVNACDSGNSRHHFHLHSATFVSGETVPLSIIHGIFSNRAYACSIDGSTSGNESPELSWTQVSRAAKSFTVSYSTSPCPLPIRVCTTFRGTPLSCSRTWELPAVPSVRRSTTILEISPMMVPVHCPTFRPTPIITW